MTQFPSGGAPFPSAPGYEAWEETPRDSRLSILAVLSLVFSLTCLLSPLGIILGVASLFTIAGSGGRRHGKGLAIAGVVIGLVCATLLTFIGVGILSFLDQFNRQGLRPAGEMMASIDGKDHAKSRVLMNAALSAATTDQAIDEFRAAYQVDWGAFKAMPSSFLDMLSMYGTVGQQMKGGKQFNNNPNRPIFPLPAHFENGPGIVLFELYLGKPEVMPGSPGSVANIGVLMKDGTMRWLMDPALVPLPGSTPPIPPPPQTPALPTPPGTPGAPATPGTGG